MVSQTMMLRSLTYFKFLVPLPGDPSLFPGKSMKTQFVNLQIYLVMKTGMIFFLDNNVNIIFNNFLNSYLRIFNACFPTIKPHISIKPKPWLSTGIRTSCANKRMLYISYRNSNDPTFKDYYKEYCKILSSVIVTAKKKKSTLIE